MTKNYVVSKSPVREALITLCRDGVLVNIPRFGYQVVPITPAQFMDMQELRVIVEESALRKTIRTITPAQIAELEENVHQGDALAEEKNIVRHWHNNMNFHLLLCKQCQNEYIYQTLVGILRFFSRGALQYYTQSWEQNKRTDTSSHGQILQALKQGDEESAVALLHRDIAYMEQEFLRK